MLQLPPVTLVPGLLYTLENSTDVPIKHDDFLWSRSDCVSLPTCKAPLPVLWNQCVFQLVLLGDAQFDLIGQLQPCAVYKTHDRSSGAQSSAAERTGFTRGETPVTDGASG